MREFGQAGFSTGDRVAADAASGPATPPAPLAGASDRHLDLLARQAGALGHDIVDVSGVLTDVRQAAERQAGLLHEISGGTARILDANRRAEDAAVRVAGNVRDTKAIVSESVTFMQASGTRSRAVAVWVADVGQQMDDVMRAVRASEKHLESISSIAREVSMLAINAKIQAARASEAGKGFGVIAQAIGELSASTERAARAIAGSLEELRTRATRLAEGAGEVNADASRVIDETEETDRALARIADRMDALNADAAAIADDSVQVRAATEACAPAIREIERDAQTATADIQRVAARTDALIEGSERMVQLTVLMGGSSADQPFIERVQADAARLGAALERALDQGKIPESDLFSRSYAPIGGTNPQQFLAPFTALTDLLFPEVQEAALAFSPKVVFCAAVDPNGYLPTHNRKFSQAQGPDPAWNTANCRNRRIFDDRVGLKAGRNTEPFLLQVYRRDMGGGVFRMMKDVSAPIRVRGRHWGGLRLAYTF